eukprot:c48768_g1_i1 orf=53-223(+)
MFLFQVDVYTLYRTVALKFEAFPALLHVPFMEGFCDKDLYAHNLSGSILFILHNLP